MSLRFARMMLPLNLALFAGFTGLLCLASPPVTAQETSLDEVPQEEASQAVDLPMEFGVAVGPSYGILSAPRQQSWDFPPIYMLPSKGWSYQFSLDYRAHLLSFGPATLFVGASLGYNHLMSSGKFVRVGVAQDSQTLTLRGSELRLPVVVGVRVGSPTLGFSLFAGPEGIFVIDARSDFVATGTVPNFHPAEIKKVVRLGLTVAAELDIRLHRFVIPVGFRYGYNPFVSSKMAERFDGASLNSKPKNIGRFKFEQNHVFFISAGFRFLL